MSLASVTLSYGGKSYTVTDDPIVLKGRLSCDCEKSRLIRGACDPEFPLLGCGAEIRVVSMVETHTPSKGPSGERRRGAVA